MGVTCQPSAVSRYLLLTGFCALGTTLSCQRTQRPADEASSQQTRQGVFTSNSGTAYITECQQNGVPVPNALFDGAWTNHGEVTDEFLSGPLQAELWSMPSVNPRGICLALPRWFTSGPNVNKAELFGIICMGQQTGKTCYWDNPTGVFFDRFQTTPISSFLGGAALLGNGGGVCSDCHAGENPFVIHPEKAAFKSLRHHFTAFLTPSGGWHLPIVPNGWPANPGPNRSVQGTTTGSCVGCHRLPEVSQALPGYCELLDIATTRADETMPLKQTPALPPFTSYADRRNQFAAHISAFKMLCSSPPVWGDVVFANSTDNPTVLSPPWVEGPVYTCTNTISVRGVLPGATVELFRRDTSGNVSSIGTRAGGVNDSVAFSLPTSATTGEAYYAAQSLGVASSSVSIEALAVEYPDDELPEPRITQPVYECADKIGLHTLIQGVNARTWKNSSPAPAFTAVSGTLGVFSPPRTPWLTGDVFSAETALCAKKSRPSSATAVALPNPIKAGKFWSPPGVSVSELYAGQEYLLLVDFDNGAYASVSSTQPTNLALGDTEADTEGETLILHLPTSPLGRTAQVGDQFSATMKFACGSVTGPPTVSTTVLPCSSLRAPRIAFPRDGDRFVTVQDFVPGARIKVYRVNTGDEIADGAPPRVMLAPPNVIRQNEPIRVVQQLGTCIGTQTFLVTPGAGQ